MTSDAVNVVANGFSLTNRSLLYVSLMLTPAQALAGIGTQWPSNLGFMAYNWWQQYTWFTATSKADLHALAIVPVYLNTVYTITYFGGLTSGNLPMGVLLGFSTAGLIFFSVFTGWAAVSGCLPQGEGVYEFFFFGWRVLSKGWRKFFFVWQVFNTLALSCAVPGAIHMGIGIAKVPIVPVRNDPRFKWFRATAVLWGSVFMLVATWPLILWMELIVKRNNIVSETDMVGVYLFVAQVATLLLPSLHSAVIGCWVLVGHTERGQAPVLPMVNIEPGAGPLQ